MSRSRISLAAALVAASAWSIHAQTLITERGLSANAALELATAALESCRKHGSQVSITVLDHAGRTKVAIRDDGAGAHSVEHSFRKAYTALTYKMPSGEYGKRAAGNFPASHGALHLPNVTTAPGGLPIFAGTALVGAVGIAGTAPPAGAGSGGGGASDAACAQVGIDRISKGMSGPETSR